MYDWFRRVRIRMDMTQRGKQRAKYRLLQETVQLGTRPSRTWVEEKAPWFKTDAGSDKEPEIWDLSNLKISVEKSGERRPDAKPRKNRASVHPAVRQGVRPTCRNMRTDAARRTRGQRGTVSGSRTSKRTGRIRWLGKLMNRPWRMKTTKPQAVKRDWIPKPTARRCADCKFRWSPTGSVQTVGVRLGARSDLRSGFGAGADSLPEQSRGASSSAVVHRLSIRPHASDRRGFSGYLDRTS